MKKDPKEYEKIFKSIKDFNPDLSKEEIEFILCYKAPEQENEIKNYPLENMKELESYQKLFQLTKKICPKMIDGELHIFLHNDIIYWYTWSQKNHKMELDEVIRNRYRHVYKDLIENEALRDLILPKKTLKSTLLQHK